MTNWNIRQVNCFLLSYFERVKIDYDTLVKASTLLQPRPHFFLQKRGGHCIGNAAAARVIQIAVVGACRELCSVSNIGGTR